MKETRNESSSEKLSFLQKIRFRIMFYRYGSLVFVMMGWLLLIFLTPILNPRFSDFPFESYSVMTLYYLGSLIFFDSLLEIKSNDTLNNTQSNWLHNHYGIILSIPVTLPILSNFLERSLINEWYVLFSSFIVFTLFGVLFKSVRYSFLSNYIFILVAAVSLKLDVLFFPFLLIVSSMLLMFGLRYAENKPSLKFMNDDLDEFKGKYRKFLQDKKESFSRSVEDYEDIIAYNRQFYFVKNDTVKKETGEKCIDATSKEILRIKTATDELRDVFSKYLETSHPKKNFKLKFVKFLPEKIRNDPEFINKFEELTTKVSKLKEKSIIRNKGDSLALIFIMVSLDLIRNQKQTRKTTNLVFTYYDQLPNKYKKRNDRPLWKSDLDLDLVTKGQDNRWVVLFVLKFLFELPSDFGISYLKKQTELYLENAHTLGYMDIAQKRLELAKKRHGDSEKGWNSIMTWNYKKTFDNIKNEIEFITELDSVLDKYSV